MEFSEIVVETTTSSDTVAGTITAAADTLLLCAVAAEVNYDSGSITGPSGWTLINQVPAGLGNGFRLVNDPRYYIQHGVWWKANAEAGDVTASATWVKDTYSPDDTPNRMVMQLLEVVGADKVDDFAFLVDSNGSNNTGIPADAKDTGIVVSREGNLGVFVLAIEDVGANLSPPSGYSVAAETDMNSRWCLASYYKALPFATVYEAQATGQSALPFMLHHIECDITTSSGSFIGGEF